MYSERSRVQQVLAPVTVLATVTLSVLPFLTLSVLATVTVSVLASVPTGPVQAELPLL